ncbi:1986_t:CDS:2 [Ambispora leptoticha]|uniref:1986_t:CDS:1 n=1 Tax=Ambispora leptoticha TaxID=144679 RepID=A0A9N9C2C9_9GLOM|nr:1986_t:CDS:2 [Ambispora leptoticha]
MHDLKFIDFILTIEHNSESASAPININHDVESTSVPIDNVGSDSAIDYEQLHYDSTVNYQQTSDPNHGVDSVSASIPIHGH